jgi:hypothetical protein
MDLEELKKIRKANIIAHKKKKKAYYLKKKQQLDQLSNEQSTSNSSIDYESELFSGNFAQKIKEIAKQQKSYVDDRKDMISAKMEEYKEKKQKYYLENKQKRLEYDKIYREKKREDLKAYRKEYYRKNKEKILARQKQAKLTKAKNGI